MQTKRLRVFAGPNGSGKTTITRIVAGAGYDLGVYVNADDIKQILTKQRELDFAQYQVTIDRDCFFEQLGESPVIQRSGRIISFEGIRIANNRLSILSEGEIDDYFVAFLADFIRHELLRSGKKFSFETVMSHPSKIDFMKQAKAAGYKVYLYYVALKDPVLNVLRVNWRAEGGGHTVPEEKIRSRYYSSLSLLSDAIAVADNSYIFDNSGGEHRLLAQVINEELRILVDYYPKWFEEYFINKRRVD